MIRTIGKVLLCDLAKGSIGDDNSRLLGSLIVLKEKLAALSRQDVPEAERVPHVRSSVRKRTISSATLNPFWPRAASTLCF